MLKGLSRLGLLEWLDTDPGKFYFRLIPAALLFFAMALALEWRHLPNDSRYFYPIAVVFTFAALSGQSVPISDTWTCADLIVFFRAGGNRKMGRSTERSVDEEGSACV